MIQFIDDKDQKERICKEILEDLPDWFGIPESTAAYVKDCRDYPFWAEIISEKAVGFIVMKETSPYTAEVYVMGVKMEYHRNGAGKRLFDAFYRYAKEKGYQFLQVKTVQQGCYPSYDRTNCFYKRMGFKELECFKTIWDQWNPCQIYVMAIS